MASNGPTKMKRGFLLGAVWLFAAARSWASADIAVQVTATKTGERALLQIGISNDSEKAVRISRNDLPWIIDSAMMIVPVVNQPDYEPMSEAFPIQDPISGVVTVQPRGGLKGTVDLFDRFPQLSRVRNREVIIFWYLPLKVIDAPPVPFGGYVRLQL